MNGSGKFAMVCIAGILAAAALISAEAPFILPPETVSLKHSPGADLVTAQCLLCHSADYISTQPPMARAIWKASVEKMRQKYGAPIPIDKVDLIVDYLVKNYGNESSTNKPAKRE